jgi:hypothetical protein
MEEEPVDYKFLLRMYLREKIFKRCDKQKCKYLRFQIEVYYNDANSYLRRTIKDDNRATIKEIQKRLSNYNPNINSSIERIKTILSKEEVDEITEKVNNDYIDVINMYDTYDLL